MTTAVRSADPLSPAVLGARASELLERDAWSREVLAAYQRERLRSLLAHAVDRSPYYREVLGPDAVDADLSELPTLPKSRLMAAFDRIVTDRRLRISELEPFLGAADAGALYLGEYRVFSTSGTTGVPGLFLYSRDEFAHWAAVFARTMARLGVTRDTRLVGIAAPSALHLSQQIVLALQAGREGAPRLSVTMPLAEMVAALDEYRPEVIAGYPSVLGLLAEEQLEGRLSIEPSVVLTTSEVLTEDAAARMERAWATPPVQGYFSTEVGVIAADSPERVGMHVCEEAIVEVVDEAGRPAEPGRPGHKLLLTNLVNRTQPLIRYELLDAVQLAEGADPSGRPYDRIEKVDGRSDEVLRLPGRDGGSVSVHPYRLRAPFVQLLDVLQYQVVRREDELLVRIVVAPAPPATSPRTRDGRSRGRPTRPVRACACASRSSRRSNGRRVTPPRSSSCSRRLPPPPEPRGRAWSALGSTGWRSRSTSRGASPSSPAARAASAARTR